MIDLKNISKSYGRKIIFNNFSLHINSKEMVAITGVSGSGKSTLLNIIGLIESVDKGIVSIDGYENIKPQSSKAIKIIRKDISYLFQNFALIDDETVGYNLMLALKYTNCNKKLAIEQALDEVGLRGFEKVKVFRLSGGEQQRVALARLMLKPSKIILADEPTGSLDEHNRDIVISTLKRIKEGDDKTVIIVTHDTYVANQCERIVDISSNTV